MKGKLKSIFFWILLLALTLGTAELTCCATFHFFKKRFTFFDFNKYFPDKVATRITFEHYHPEFGWDNNTYPTPWGERPRSVEYHKSLIAAFGDSFTQCYQVGDNETWEERLSVLLQANVYNFGVGGYGPDQACLKFLSLFPKVRTPIVILGLTTENINRIVNVYRPFYYQDPRIKMPKPRFILSRDRLLLLPNPLRSLNEIGNLQDAYFLSQMGQNDFWFNRDKYPELKFPYLKILFNKRIWLEMIHARKGDKVSDMIPRPYANLWKDAEPTALMLQILGSFAAAAKDQGAIPIIMIAPFKGEVIDKFKNGSRSDGEKKILGFCWDHNILVFDSIEALANRAHSISEIESFFEDHVSPKGNRIMAEALYDFLKAHVLSAKK